MSIDSKGFKEAMAHFASGVTVVTTEHEGAPYGMTVAAFTSVSLDPPMVLVCIAHSATSCKPISLSRKFAVHILGKEQAALGAKFGGGAKTMEERFAGITVERAETGSPILPGCVAYIDCEVRDAHEAGDHTIFVGSVVSARAQGGEVLLHYARTFRTVSEPLSLE